MKLSDYIVDFFEKQNISHVFMVAGGGCMHLVNSFGNSEKIKYICLHHEQSAAMAAEAYAKYTNNIALTLVTCGPGSTNALTGVLGAYQDSVPCIFISGQAKVKQTVYHSSITGLRQFGAQEVNIMPIVQSITKYAVTITEPEKIRYYLEKAVFLASNGRPGPVWIDIPLDIQSAIIDESSLEGYVIEQSNIVKTIPTDDEIQYFKNRIENAKRPVVIAGHGVRLANACENLISFVEKYNIPCVTPIMGIDVIPEASKCCIGKIGTKGTRAGNFTMQNADLIIVIGSRLAVSVIGHEYELFAREADVIIIDIDEIEHTKETITPKKIILADAKQFLLYLPAIEGNWKLWLDKCNSWKQKYPVCLSEYNDDSKGINQYKFMDILAEHMSCSMTYISDAGSAFYITSQASKVKKGQRYITSGALATMGFTIPAAVGVAVANDNPMNSTIGITGDGSFQQNMQELSIIKYLNLPIKIFVLNNDGYLSIRSTQNKFFGGNLIGEGPKTGVPIPSTEKISNAFDIKYIYISSIGELCRSIDMILNCNEPLIVEIKLASDQEVIPTNSAKLLGNGKMVSAPLEDMYPFLDRDEFRSTMIVDPVLEEK